MFGLSNILAGESLQDHSIPRRSISISCNRICLSSIILYGLLGGISIVLIIHEYYNYNDDSTTRTFTHLGLTSPLPDYQVHFSKGQLTVTGQGDLGAPEISSALISLPPTIDLKKLTTLEIRNVLIDAHKFSNSLQGRVQNLQKLKLDQVWVAGEFETLFLPTLTEFHFNFIHNDGTDAYKPSTPLKNLLFFDLGGQNWTIENDLLHLGVKIFLGVGGTTILDVDRTEGKINLNVHYCNEILEELPGEFPEFPPVTEMTLSWCSILANDLPRTLKYLNLNNAIPRTQELAAIFNSLQELEEFHGFLPRGGQEDSEWNSNTGPTKLDISNLPSTLKILSLSNVNLDFRSRVIHKSKLRQLSLENSLDWTWTLSKNFVVTFPNLEKFALFNAISIQNPYKFLHMLLRMGVKWILMENFPVTVKKGYEITIRKILTKAGIPQESEDFVLEFVGSRSRDSSGSDSNVSNSDFQYTGKSLTLYEKNYYRYILLGFDKVDTYEDYVIWDR